MRWNFARIASGRNFKGRGQVFLNPGKTLHHSRAIQRKFWHAHRKTQLRSETSPGIARNRDVIHFGEFYADLIEAVADRARGKPGGVFHSIQPLFFDGRNQLTVGHDRRGRIGVIGVDSQNYHVRTWPGNSMLTIGASYLRRLDSQLVARARLFHSQVTFNPLVQHV